MGGERILVVDDRIENVDFIVDYVLKPNGFVSLVARDGEEGLHRALTEQPDLILLDVQMPRMTGIEVLEALAERDLRIPVILMTLHGSEELAVHVFRLGVRDYVIKPFDVDQMLSAIERALIEVRLVRERDALFEHLVDANRKLELRVRELSVLSSIGKSVAGLLDLEQLLGRLVDAALYITGAEEGWLMLVDEDTDELYIRAAKGLDLKQTRTMRMRVDDSLAGAVIKSGEPIVIGSGHHKVKTAYLVKSLLAVPLKIGQRAVGVLSVAFRIADQEFGNTEMGLLSALADYAAIAIGNANFYTEVEESKGRLEAILGGTSDAILVTDAQDKVLLVNQAASRVLETSVADAVGQELGQVVKSQALRDLYATLGQGRADVHGEVPVNGGRTYNAHLTPVPEIGTVVVMQDITHLKELEQLKNDFVSTVSHDLRTPLTSVRGFVDLLQMAGPLNEDQQHFALKIRKGTEDIIDLIQDLLDLSRIETGAAFEFEPVSLAEVIVESVDVLHGQAEVKHQGLDVHLPAGLPKVMGNRLRLGQVVKNLVGNAIKYTPEHGQIRVWAEEQQGQVLVHVKDTGLGISAIDQSQIFEKFYRVKTEETEDIPGTGLGLAISKSIIDLHDGRIWVHSQLGEGSIFTFLLSACGQG